MLSEDVRNSISESVLCWLATANSEGTPNVSPKVVFLAYGEEEIIIANIASPRSVKNITQNPKVCVSFVHVFKQKGYKVHGEAQYLTEQNAGYQERYSPIYKITQET
ncbi:MAG: pyridoxamine 5'-phosphate oxidase family protein [Exilibacterium sp.]